MNKFSICVIEDSERPLKVRKILSIFVHHSEILEGHLDGQLTEILPNETYVNETRVVGYSECVTRVETWIKSETAIRGRLESSTEDFLKNYKSITFNESSGQFLSINLNGEVDPNAKLSIDNERRARLTEMFNKSGALMKSSSGFHYVKPSGKHVSEFLRISNVLEASENASSIAFWLLPYLWKKQIRHIVVDTSGISSIAYVLAYEVLKRGGIEVLPTISSHKSYGGLDSFKLSNPDQTLFIISASTSGGLVEKLIIKGAKLDNIVTLFYLGDVESNSGHVLCDLNKHEIENPTGILAPTNYSEDDCPECKERSFPIKLEGDQFTLEPPKVEEVLIARDDLPKEQRDTLDKLAGTGFFKVFRNLEQRQLEIFLDIASLFPSEVEDSDPNKALFNEFQAKYKAMVRRGLPVHVKRIVHSKYPFSEELAIAAVGVLKEYGGNDEDCLIASRELRKVNPAQPETASLIVTACMDDAHELMSINRDLRAIQPYGNTTYISPIFRAGSKTERNRIRSSLTYGENGPNTFNLYSLYEIDLPECIKQHTWTLEIEYLNKIITWADLQGIDIPIEVTNRLSFLQNAPAHGLSNGLFWKSPKGIDLKIRPDFTLIDTSGGARNISQADVYVAVSTLLLNLRNGVKDKPCLSHRPYAWAVLSPENFQRFNDGVIQAALLRSSRSYELVYTSEDRLSIRLKDLILTQIENISKGLDDGEALIEFLLAMIMRKLVLNKAHQDEICEKVKSVPFPSHVHLFADYLKEN